MQVLELDPIGDRPAGELVQSPHRLSRPQLDHITISGAAAPQTRRQGRRTRGRPECDPQAGRVSPREGFRRALRYELAAHDDRNAIGELLGLFHVVRRQEDRLAERSQIHDHFPRPPPRGRVEAGRGLVEEQEIRVAGEPDRNVEAPLLASRQAPDALVAFLLKPDKLDDLVERARARVVPPIAFDGLGDGQEGVHAGVLENDSDALAKGPLSGRGVAPENLDVSMVGFSVALHDLDRRRLAGTVRAKKGEHFTRCHVEVYAVYCVNRSVRLVESPDLNCLHVHAPEHKLPEMSDFLQTPPTLEDAWKSDRILRDALRWHVGDDLFPLAEGDLAEIGRWATSPEALELAHRAEREPAEHVAFGPWGHRVDTVRVSDAYRELGRKGVAAGVTALPYESTLYEDKARVVWAGLLALWGPSSALYSCPVAMTDGAARTLIEYGGADEMTVAGRLTTRDLDRAWTSGQWMTETSGGSDLSRTETIARRDSDGTWRLFGSKWFTSAVDANVALTLARPEASGEGSRALALFRIHRILDDGETPNSIVVRRLKDKLGTRALPTAELELNGAVAHPVGEPAAGDGIRRMSTMLNITRVHNAIGSAAALARGLAWARAYARVREVSGMLLSEQSAHRAVLADLAVDYAAALELSLRCAELLGRAEHGTISDDEVAVLRGLISVTKLATARWAVAGVTEAMEAIGGVGYCEDSGIPALVRNTHVLPIWEGTTNVLSLDFLRAASSAGALEAIIADAVRAVDATEADPVPAAAEITPGIRRALEMLRNKNEELSGRDEAGRLFARTLALGVANTYACARLCLQGAWAAQRGDRRTLEMAARLLQRGLLPPPPPGALHLGMDEQSEQSEPLTP
jgi:acyl-CoA dehydrogenase